MIGVLLVGHAKIASETKRAVEHILGEQMQLEALDVTNSDVSAQEEKQLLCLLERLDTGQGVLVLVDVQGATPWNMVQGLMLDRHMRMVSGFNLPAVIRAMTLREEDDLTALAESCVEAGKHYMRLVQEQD